MQAKPLFQPLLPLPRRTLLSLGASSLAAVLCGLSLTSPAHAADAYPNKPVKLIVPFAAGGSTDIVARVIAEGLRSTLGQPVVVDNKAGAGGLIGTESMAQAAPDGYTIGMATVSTATINPSLYMRAAKLEGRLLPVANLVTMPSVYMVHPKMGVKDFPGFLAKLRAQPGAYSAGVPGLGTLGHLMVASFNETMKTQVQIVPYRGNGPALNDALAGMVQVMTDQLPSAMPQIKGGKLIPVALSGDSRSPDLPDVPTFKELGYAQLNELGISWFGLVVPAGTPAAIVRQLQDASVKAVRLPEVQKHLKLLGASVTEMDQSRFPAQIASELQRNKALLDKAGVKPE
ncbi:MAG: ABC transporter substrate-binding protein [Delftia acidovorans]|jgi:tripartite-type tricarboxylate transporter receptor subunit TctC|nr:ABC transporter substrate-binding protein [Delftia acidovorans]